ncbi:MAG: SH3 domain-containing protein [Spirochaetaceae bacterium]|jgi:hypothetical protein|nr:SH3 domain-containing protein [Spirochaetaceae bacterium]
MKKFTFLTLLIFLAVFLFAQTASDYDKILTGDFSAFVGYYVNESNNRRFLPSDGKISAPSNYQTGNFKKTGGVYTWDIWGSQEGSSVMLFPIGVDIRGIKTDTTRVRICFTTLRLDTPSNSNAVYYKESKFPATHVVSENLELKNLEDLNSETIKILEKGTEVLVLLWRNNVIIDGNSGRWVYICTIDGASGYCYSGYLEEIKE